MAPRVGRGPLVTLACRQHWSGSTLWGLFVRTFVLDDVMYEPVPVVPSWLAPWSLAQGWIGFAREELALNPWLNFYAANGYAYAASPGAEPKALRAGAPPFTATQTTED